VKGMTPEETWLELRWIEKQLTQRRSTERGRLLAQRWLEKMRTPGSEPLFGSLPAAFRERYQARIEGLLTPVTSPPPAGDSPPSPPSAQG
jgi:hypothetical protein